jgi:hypothetical protein
MTPRHFAMSGRRSQPHATRSCALRHPRTATATSAG